MSLAPWQQHVVQSFIKAGKVTVPRADYLLVEREPALSRVLHALETKGLTNQVEGKDWTSIDRLAGRVGGR